MLIYKFVNLKFLLKFVLQFFVILQMGLHFANLFNINILWKRKSLNLFGQTPLD